MNALAEQLVALSQDGIWVIALVFVRVSAAMALLPAFGEQVTPMRVKLAAAMAFALIVTPAVMPHMSQAYAQHGWVSLLSTEVIAGLAIGILFRLFVIALQIAGTVAAQATSLSQIFGGGIGTEPQPAMATLLVVAGLCLAVMAGLHVRVAEALIMSYEVFPAGQSILAADLTRWGIAQIAQAFSLGLTLAMPFLIASAIYNLALGAINRAMPQLMVALVGAPAISLGGLVLLMLVAPAMISVWLAVFFDAIQMQPGLP